MGLHIPKIYPVRLIGPSGFYASIAFVCFVGDVAGHGCEEGVDIAVVGPIFVVGGL